MDRIGCLGISWRNGGPEALARFTVPAEERAQWMIRFARKTSVTELVYLATCNRVEIVFVSDGRTPLTRYRAPFFEALVGRLPKPGEAERSFRAWGGEGAAEHIFLVTSGLDSARIGESEITGQVRESYELAREHGLTGTRLDLLFDQAHKIAARVHSCTTIATGRESLAEIALDHLRARMRRTPGSMAVLGVSAMTERCARSLAREGARVIVVNRTLERAEKLAREIGGEARALGAFLEEPDGIEAIISATGARDPILRRPHLEKMAARCPSGETLLAIDMAVPPDIDPEASRLVGIERIDMKNIIATAEESRQRHLMQAAEGRQIVDEALIDFRRRLIDRVLAPLFAAVQRRYRQTAVEGVERLFRKELSGLGEEERQAVRNWAETLARRFAHLPTTGLRGVAYEAGSAAVEAFVSQADESMVDVLRDAGRRADVVLDTGEESA